MKFRYSPLFSPADGFMGGGGGAGDPGAAAGTPSAAPVGTPSAAPGAPAPGAPVPGQGGFDMAGFAGTDGKFIEGAFSAERLQAMGIEGANPLDLQKFGTVPELIKSYVHKSKLVGAKGVILPTEGSPPEVINEFRRQMGIPNTPEEYDFTPKDLPEGVTWDDAKGKEYGKVFHELGISQTAAAKLAELQANDQAAMYAKFKQQQVDSLNADWAESEKYLQEEYGDSSSNRHESLKAFVGTIKGLDLKNPEHTRALSMPWVLRLIDESMKGLTEAPLPGSGGGQFQGNGNMSYLDKARAIKKTPGWEKDPSLVKQVNTLYDAHAKSEARKR